ncbi:MAG: histidine phosphatase family protein [Helicobacteraceae bacterium]|nr:histidine phosphatase family protein [Candidatus Sulfurimonas ponti]
MIITLLRHAEVVEEYQGKYNGHINIPLSENGKKQAKHIAQKLQDEAFDAVYCSDLLRAKQTLEAFDIAAPIVYTEKLREKSWGMHEGKSFEELEQSGLVYESFEDWLELLDGEDIYEYLRNIETFFEDVIYKLDAQNVLVVTHSGPIKTILRIQDNLSLERAFGIDLPYGAHLKIHRPEV